MSYLPGTSRGAFRAYAFGAFICLAGFLFGYDTGIVGGVLTLPSYKQDFRYTDSTTVNSVMVSVQNAAAFLSCASSFPISDRYGRRKTILLAMITFCLGVILQVVPSHSLTCFYIGRIVAGLGLGAATAVVPMYSAEMTPKEIRGRVGSGVQLLFTLGVMISYWIDYGCKVGLPESSKQWQIPVGLQLVPSAFLGLGMLYVKESVRWLAKKGRNEEAWESICWIRADNGPEVKAEFNEILVGVAEELRASEGFKKKELLEPANRRRLFISFSIFLAQQCTGMTALAYFAPQFFMIVVGKDANRSLLITGLFGAQKFITCLAYVVLVSEKWGRRPTLVIAPFIMSALFIIVTVVNKTTSPGTSASPSSAAIATVAMIFLTNSDNPLYQFSYGPVAWPYCTEIFPSRIREIGTSVGVSTQWFFNFVFSLVTQYMISAWGSYTFIFYASLHIIIGIWAYFFIVETRGRSLEEMETIFHSKAAFDVQAAREQALNKQVDEILDSQVVAPRKTASHEE